jgi:hypothetical protein
MFCLFAGNKSAPEATFVESAAGGFIEATASSTRFVESATTGLKSTLLYCHLNCLVKPPSPKGGIYFETILNRELRLKNICYSVCADLQCRLKIEH